MYKKSLSGLSFIVLLTFYAVSASCAKSNLSTQSFGVSDPGQSVTGSALADQTVINDTVQGSGTAELTNPTSDPVLADSTATPTPEPTATDNIKAADATPTPTPPPDYSTGGTGQLNIILDPTTPIRRNTL